MTRIGKAPECRKSGFFCSVSTTSGRQLRGLDGSRRKLTAASAERRFSVGELPSVLENLLSHDPDRQLAILEERMKTMQTDDKTEIAMLEKRSAMRKLQSKRLGCSWR